MKKTIKILAVLFSVAIALTLCSCNKKDETQLSSAPTTTQNSRTLLRAMTASDDISNIEEIKILSGTCATGAPVITDKNDLQFLQKYTYSHYRVTKKEYAEQLLKDKTDYSLEVVTNTGEKIYLYIMQDGGIAIRQMCGDSEVPEIAYDFYTADKENTLTKEKLELLSNEEN